MEGIREELMRADIMPEWGAAAVDKGGSGGGQRRLCVRDAEGAPKGRSRLALRGETELREPRSSPTRAQRGARPETHLELRSGIIPT